jgi:hypothetical protein
MGSRQEELFLSSPWRNRGYENGFLNLSIQFRISPNRTDHVFAGVTGARTSHLIGVFNKRVLRGFAGKFNAGAQGTTKRCTTETRRAQRLSRRTEDGRFGKPASEPAKGSEASGEWVDVPPCDLRVPGVDLVSFSLQNP